MEHVMRQSRIRNSKAFDTRRFAWVHRLMESSRPPASVKLVAYQISRGFNEAEGGASWLGCRALSKAAGLKKTVVLRAIKWLQEHGDLRVQVGHQGNSSRYWLIEKDREPDLFDAPQGHRADLEQGHRADLEQEAQGPISHPQGPNTSTTRSQGGPNLNKTQQESKEGNNIYRPPLSGDVGKRAAAGKKESKAVRSTTGCPKSRPADPSADPPGFPEFLTAFPRKGGIDAARTAFRSAVARGADPAELVAAAKRYAIERAALPDEQRKYTYGPIRWLDEECWKVSPHDGALVIDQAGNPVAFPRRTENPRKDRTWDEVAANVALVMWGGDHAQQH
jgi:hypothetical protein